MGSIKHAKTSPVPNPLGDTRRVGGGDWNSEHVIDLDVSDINGLEARLIPVAQVEQFRDDALQFRNEAAGSATDAAASAAEAASTVGALAAPGGAELIGTPEGTVQVALDGRVKQDELAAPATVPAYAFSAAEAQSIFDNALPLERYADMLAYNERAQGIRITGHYATSKPDGRVGTFQYNPSAPNSSNGGTRFAHASGVGAWERAYSGGVYLTWFEADGTGVVDISAALDKAIAFLDSIGGGVILGQPEDTYRLDGTYTITKSNIHFDWQWARLSGIGRFVFSGDSGVAGDWSKAVRNDTFRRARIGGPGASEAYTPLFLYCIDCVMEDIDREGYGNTAINMFICRNTHFRRIKTVGGKDSGGGSIAALGLLCQDCTFENIYASKGPFVFGCQFKGGTNNKVIDCTLDSVKNGTTVKMSYGFYNRGDAPWGSSTTGTAGYSYPWADLDWTVPDARRASNDCQYIRCVVSNSDVEFLGFQSQEFIGGGFYQCTAKNNNGGASFGVLKLSGGSERNFDLIDLSAERDGTPTIGSHDFSFASSDASSLKGLKFRGGRSLRSPLNGVNASNVQFDEFDHITVIDSAQLGIPAYLRGMRFEAGCLGVVSNSRVVDTRGTPVITSGFSSDANTSGIVMGSGNTVSGFAAAGRPYEMNRPITWGVGNSPAVVRTTTTGVGDTAAFLFTPVDGSKVYAEFSVVGKDAATGDMGVWKIAGVFTAAAGVSSQVGATIALTPAVNPGAWGGVTFQIVSNSVRLVLIGKAAATIAWSGNVAMQIL